MRIRGSSTGLSSASTKSAGPDARLRSDIPAARFVSTSSGDVDGVVFAVVD